MTIKLDFPPRKILVPLDLTEASVLAWKQAKALGAAYGAKVDGLFVQPWLMPTVGPGFAIPTPLSIDMEAALGALRRSLGAADEEINMVMGAIEPTILSWGKNLGYDLIVMGTHGRAGLSRMLMGSIAEAIARGSTIPVLITRRADSKFRDILAPVNFEPYSIDGLLAAAKVAAVLAARLTALHVVSVPLYGGPGALKGSKHLLADAINRIPRADRDVCRPRAKLAFGDAAEQIAQAATGADLVVLVAHRKGFLNDTVLGTTTERLLRQSAASVLALPFQRSAKAGARNGRVRSAQRDRSR